MFFVRVNISISYISIVQPVGVLYGVTNVCAGHPFDTIKTKMQAQAGYEKQSMVRSFVRTLKADGIRGLYRYSNHLFFVFCVEEGIELAKACILNVFSIS